MHIRQPGARLATISLIAATLALGFAAYPAHAQDTVPPLSAPAGVAPAIDVKSTLAAKLDYDVNSWFAIGHLNAGGHKIGYLYHILITPAPDGKPIIQSVLSITDETTGWYRSADVVLPYDEKLLSGPGLTIKMPNGEMQLSLEDIHVKAALADGSFDLHLKPSGRVLYNGGTGVFPLLGMTINEYSLPRLTSQGTITIEGKTYQASGDSWFDRQWQNSPKGGGAGMPAGLRWSWAGLNLSNGDALSVWSVPDPAIGKLRAWATILHKDGSQTVAAVAPDLGATDEWTSEKSGNRYPTRWTIRIPALRAVLNVVPRPRHQEIISELPSLNKYEGASVVSGTYAGKPVSGSGYVELIGDWK